MKKIKLFSDESAERVITDYYHNNFQTQNQMDELIGNVL